MNELFFFVAILELSARFVVVPSNFACHTGFVTAGLAGEDVAIKVQLTVVACSRHTPVEVRIRRKDGSYLGV